MATPTKTAKSDERAAREQFDLAWDHFFTAVRSARGHAAAVAEREGLSLAQYQLLLSFAGAEAADGMPVGLLAEAAGVAQPTATRMLDGLERQGVVERRPSSEDRRSVVVALTAEGRRILQRKRKLVERKRRAVYESLPADDRDRAAALLDLLAEAIEKEGS